MFFSPPHFQTSLYLINSLFLFPLCSCYQAHFPLGWSLACTCTPLIFSLLISWGHLYLYCSVVRRSSHHHTPWVLSTVCSEMSWLNPTPLLGFYQGFGQFLVCVIFTNCSISQKNPHCPSEKCMNKIKTSAAMLSLEQDCMFYLLTSGNTHPLNIRDLMTHSNHEDDILSCSNWSML